MITSTQNKKIKWIRSLQIDNHQRRTEKAFVIEGVRLVQEALAAGWTAKLILFSDNLPPAGKNLIEEFANKGALVELVSPHVMQSASDTKSPQGILAVVPMKKLGVPEEPDLLLIVDSIRDPGNLGTIFRSALAAGVDGVLIPPDNADPFSPKVVRASMGAHFRMPIPSLTWQETARSTSGMPVFLASSHEGQTYTSVEYPPSLALIIGGEAHGAGQEAHNLATDLLHIPMPGGSESLNTSAAAAIMLFEIVRQRSIKNP